jgi:acyl carrier protein
MTTQKDFDTVEIGPELEDMLVQAAGLDRAALATAGDSTLEDLGMESLAAMELQAVVKSRYGVQIPDELLELSVPQIAGLIETSLKEGQ